MKIITTLIISFVLALCLIIYERKSYKKHILKAFIEFWVTIEVLIIFLSVQILGIINLFK